MFRFAHPEYLYGLIIIPAFLLILWYARARRRKAVNAFGNPELLQQLMPNVSQARPVVKFIFTMLAITLVVIGLAQPQFGSKLQKVKRKGIEVVIALDVSNSMLAEDIKPNRLERAKRAISRLVDRMRDDRIGLIVFAGDAYTQLPITNDYASAKLFLSSVNTNIVPIQGTAIGKAIELGTHSFSPETDKSKALIIITDGENHEDDALGAATAAAEQGIVVHTIGMGLPQGSPIPILLQSGQTDYRRDKEGKVVITKLNEEMLQQIAAAGNGAYVGASNTQVGLNHIFDEINKMEKTEMESKVYSEYNEQFQYFIGFALFFLLLEIALMERKNKYLQRVKLFDKK